VLVSVQRAAICGSDLAIFKGTRSAEYPLVMGHEAVGYIADPGESEHAHGSLVVIEPNIPCGRCEVCRRGHGNVCPNKHSLGMNWPGTFADLVAVPSEFAHPVPPQVNVEDAVGVEPLAVALHAVRAGNAGEGNRVAVVGCGAQGLLLVQVLVAFGARVVAADLDADRLRLAQQLGAEAGVHISSDAPGDLDTRLSVPVVFEAAGTASALDLALRAATPAGRVVALGLGTAPVALLPLDFVRRGLTLNGSLIYDHPTDFQQAIQFVAEQRIKPSQLVSQVVDGLTALPSVLGSLASNDVGGKTVVRIEERE
jgi:threonine dehydrogenase-like Zn-dependent dehydrogenase